MIRSYSRLLILLLCVWHGSAYADIKKFEYSSQWQKIHDGHYLGNELWANPLQDWRIKDGMLGCHVSGGERNVFLLTRELSSSGNYFQTSINLKAANKFLHKPTKGYVGFRLGIKGQYNDYRDSAIRGRGFKVGISSEGRLFIGDTEGPAIQIADRSITLNLQAHKNKMRHWDLTLSVLSENKRELAKLSRHNVSENFVLGGVGLSCHAGEFNTREPYQKTSQKKRVKTARHGNIVFSFDDWKISGDAVRVFKGRTFGPIAFTMFTVDSKLLRMSAQMFPVPKGAGDQVHLQLKLPNKRTWKTVASSIIDKRSRVAQFEIPNWAYKTQIPFRVFYPMKGKLGGTEEFYYSGSIQAEPKQLKVASLSCQLDLGFPHQDMVKYISKHNPDMLMFTGDQYYEANAGYGVQSSPLEHAYLDYLRKWYQFGWAFRSLFKNVPSVFLLDDHDVYHGNIWGEAGKKAQGKAGADIQDSGGFKMPAVWVNAVQKSMASHLPAPYDPTSVNQDISVYYTDLQYAGVSFAIIEDRKWKSAPRQLLPDAKIVNGFSKNLKWDAVKSGDVEGAILLGDRQLEFLEQWSYDWSNNTKMKAVVSQTLFSSVQTRPKADIIGFKDRGMKPVLAGKYPQGDIVVQDFDTNGWPQTPRKNAIKKIRKAFAYHIAGDTHLGVTFQYGIDGWGNAGWAVGSPAISNVWPRRWFPSQYPRHYSNGSPRYLGDFKDGFGNPITVKAVANPTNVTVEPIHINERAPGYNILTFDTEHQSLTVEAWPRWVDPLADGATQFKGWPIIIKQLENGYPVDGPVLRTIEADTSEGAVLQVINQDSDEIIYTVRFIQKSFDVKVFHKGRYQIRVYDHNMKLVQEYSDLMVMQ